MHLPTSKNLLHSGKFWGGTLGKMLFVFYSALANARVSVWVAGILIRHEAARCRTIDDYIDLTAKVFPNFPLRRWRIVPGQVKDEIAGLLEILSARRLGRILEIGTSGGGTLFLFTRVASPDALIISVDLPGGSHGGGYPLWRTSLYQSFATEGQRIELLRADSHLKQTLDDVRKLLEGEKLDFLFIDGDHSYEGVRKDYEMYSDLVREGGLIAFHDICPHAPEKGCEVDRFWLEIRDGFRHEELVKNWRQGWAGIGLIYV